MSDHVENECEMKVICCDHCKFECPRGELPMHIQDQCLELEIQCPFKEYGCAHLMKRKLLQSHLETEKVHHLELKVTALEMKGSCSSNVNYVMVILNSGDLLRCDIVTRQKQSVSAPRRSDRFDRFDFYCLGKNVPSYAAEQIGFDPAEFPIFGGDIVFGRDSKQIGAFSVDSGRWQLYDGQMLWKRGATVWTETRGLLTIGGESISDPLIADFGRRAGISSIQLNKDGTFDNGRFRCQAKYYADVIWPGVLVLNQETEKLFICGGWRNPCERSQAEMYNLEDNAIINLKDMNHCHHSPGVCSWENNEQRIVVVGGYNENRFVEQYDMVKNQWIDLPKLDAKHGSYPAIWSHGEVLLCCGGEMASDYLGCIEMLDSRDRSRKWRQIDNVQRYFGIKQIAGGSRAFNGILPM